MQANYVGMPNLPGWTITGTHSVLLDQFEQTLTILEIYERNLDSLMQEFTAVEDETKAQEVVYASQDVRAAFSQLAALAATFCQKSKDKELKKEVSESREAKQKSHTELQMKAARIQKKLSDMRAAGGGRLENGSSSSSSSNRSMKPVAELQPSITAHFKLSGVDFDKWTKEMQVWSTASNFSVAEPTVQAAFAQKYVETEFDEKIREKAEEDGIELTFDKYVQLAESLFREQSSIFLRRVEFFQMKPKENSAKALLTYLTKLQTEFKAAEISSLMNAEDFATYKVISEMGNAMRPKVIENTQKGVTCTELKSQLERLHALKQMDEALELKKPKVFKVGTGGGSGGVSNSGGGGGSQGHRGGGGGAGGGGSSSATGGNNGNSGGNGITPRRGLPPGLDITKVGCLKCTGDHRARDCPHKDLQCDYCSRRGHIREICFRKMENEGIIPAREASNGGQQLQQSRAPSPAGGRPPTPHSLNPSLGQIKAFSISDRVVRDNMPRKELQLWPHRGRGRPTRIVNGLFDTGASVSILNAGIARSMELEWVSQSPASSSLKLASADNKEIPILGSVQVWIKALGAKYKRLITVIVVEDIDEEFILGIDQLKALRYLPTNWPAVSPDNEGEEEGDKEEEEAEEREQEEEKCYTIRGEMEKLREVEEEMGSEEEHKKQDEEWITSESCCDLFPGEETVEDIPGLSELPERLQAILRKHPRVFSNKLRKEGAIKWPPLEIEMKEGAKYPRTMTRARQPPAALIDQAYSQIQEMESEGILVKVTEPTTYNSAGFWLPKSSDRSKARFLSDQRGTNEIIKRTYHPAYDPQQIIRTMAPDLRCYWVCDMSSSYHQLRISEDSSKKFFNVLTAFGVYRFTRLIQGCSISSDILGTAMEHKFSDLLASRQLARDMDDWISGSKTEEEAMNMLEIFLQRCEDNNVVLSPKKFQWSGLDGKVKWAGLEVQQGTSKPDPDRIKALAMMEEPTDKGSLRRWLGMANTLGNYVAGISKKSALQRELLKKESAWIWSEDVSNEFKALRAELSNPNCLFNYSKDMDVGISIDCQSGGEADTSGCTGVGFHAFQYYRDQVKAKQTGLGGPLGGRGWNGVQSLQFGSIAAKQSWKQKAAMVVELLGTISALFKLNFFTRGQQILDIFLDSKPIVQAWEGKSLDNLSPALQPLLIELARWPVRLHWVQGKSHVVPDALGRAAVEGEEDHHPGVEQVEQSFPHLSGGAAGEYTLAEVGSTIHRLFNILSTQDKDEEIGDEHLAWELAFSELFDAAEEDKAYSEVCDKVQQGVKLAQVKKSHPANPVKVYQKWWDSLSVLSNSKGQHLLILNNNQVVVPSEMRKTLLERVHAHHKGVQLTKAFLDRYYFWPDLAAQVRSICSTCTTCEENKPSKPKEVQPKMFRPKQPWEAIGIDFFTFQNKQILLTVDMLTNYILLHHFTAAPSTTQILSALDTIFLSNGGFPRILASDGQLSLNSAEFNEYCNQKWILHRLSSVGNSGSNGAAERSIGEVRRTFEKVAREKGASLTKAEMATTLALLNDTPRGSQKASPTFLHFRRQFRHPNFPALETIKSDDFFEEEEKARSEEREARREASNSRVSATNAPSILKLEVGLKVMIQDKVSRKFTIPGEIVEVKSERSAIVRNSETGSLMLRNRRFLRKDLNFETPVVQGHVLNAIKSVECANVTPILKSCGNQKQTKKNVTFATQEVQIEKEEEEPQQATLGAAIEVRGSSSLPGWVQEKLQQYSRDGVIKRNISPEHLESSLVDTRVEEFVRDWARDSIDDISLSCIRKEREAIKRLREAGLRTRSQLDCSDPAAAHVSVCAECSNLSLGLPLYVRACKPSNTQENELFISFADYISVPGNKIYEAFQDTFFNDNDD